MADPRFERAFDVECLSLGTPTNATYTKVALLSGTEVPPALNIDVPIGSLYLDQQGGNIYRKFNTGTADWAMVNDNLVYPAPVLTVTTPYAITVPVILLVDATAGNMVVNLPSGISLDKRAIFIKKIAGGSTRTITINRTGTDLIDNALTTYSFSTLYQTERLVGKFGGWIRV